MFGWFRNAFLRTSIPSSPVPSSSTQVIYARLSPELSRLAVEESIECGPPRAATQPAVRQAVSRRRLARLRRFSRRFTAMSLTEARMLIAVHRGSLRAVAADNAGQLHRDIQRFLLSTRGQIAFNGKNAPGIEKIRQWVTEARQFTRTRVIDPVR